MTQPLQQSDLEGFLDEALPPGEMSRIEERLRREPELARRLAEINARRDAGVHSLGEIWRRHRVSCPTRENWGSYLLGALAPEMADYMKFHVEVVGCRYCQANLADLENQQAEAAQEVQTRRQRYFQSSAGYLRPK